MENTSTNHQSGITNKFLDYLEFILEEISLIKNIINLYDSKIEQKLFDLEIEFDCLKLNLKYSETILSSFLEYKADSLDDHKIKMLRLFDFALYEFKRLRIKYEEMDEFYFTLDEENNYIKNIKNFIQTYELKPTRVGCMFLKVFSYYFKKIRKILKNFSEKLYLIANQEKEKLKFLNNKIQFLCKIIYTYLAGGEHYMMNAINCTQPNEILKMAITDLNSINSFEFKSKKMEDFLKNLIQIAYFKIKMEKCGTKKLISTIKNRLKSFLLNSEEDYTEHIYGLEMPDNNMLKLIFEALEYKLITLSEQETTKVNEVLYFLIKGFEHFKLMKEVEGIKRLQSGGKNLVKFRILTNQIVKINYNYYNFNDEIGSNDPKLREINFFGLLLRVSKDFLTPSYNVIIHIHGGGLFSQSSESHLNYLTKWAIETESVIISLDYKLTQDNKYPIILDECIKVYESIVKYSEKLFNFSINKLIIYSDSVGSIIALDLIKYSIKRKLKQPDLAIFVYPCPNMMINNLDYLKDSKDQISFFAFDEILDIPIYVKLQEMFLNCGSNEETYKNDDRLNFFLTDPSIIESFPNSLIISPANEPIREQCLKFAEFLKSNKVPITYKQILYYCNGFLQIPSLFETSYTATLDYILNFIKEFINNNFSYKEKIPNENFSSSNSTTSA